jgi:cob(I)alamin adenosyltransferase
MDKIYTKTGDKGFTSNLLNKRYYKGDIEIELQGGVDEINANVGYLRSILKLKNRSIQESELESLDNDLKNIQYDLYLIGIEISTEFTEIHITDDEIKLLESKIDIMVDKTEPMKSFIYYSGVEAAAYSHIIRAITRRVERVFVKSLGDSVYPKSFEYLNRLSDYFFTLSRYVNFLEGLSDEPMNLK